MLGTTANAMANMEALVHRYGPAPRAFLVVPMVGAFFIDFINAILIIMFLVCREPYGPDIARTGLGPADRYTKGDSLLKHALAVEAAVRGYARTFGEDEEAWGIVGSAPRLRLRALAEPRATTRSGAPRSCASRAIPSGVIRAILSHARRHRRARATALLEKTLFACDELAGLHHRRVAGAAVARACSTSRPARS